QFDYSEVALDGYIAGDDLSVVAQGAFADKNAGEGKSVTITSLTIQGDDAGNYELDVDNSQNTVQASITRKAIYVSGIEQGSTQGNFVKKTYDGTTDITKNYFSLLHVVYNGIVAGDTLGLDFSGVLEDKNAGEGKTAGLVDLTLTGDDAGNYYLPDEGQQTTVTGLIVSKRYLGASSTGFKSGYGTKEYNGTTQYTVYASELKELGWLGAQGPIAGDDVSLDYIVVTVADKNVGEGKSMYHKYLTFYLKGADADNYSCGSNDAGFPSYRSFTVAPKALTLTGVKANDKTYDGTAEATVDLSNALLSGVCAGDQVSLASVVGHFANRNAGNDKVVTYDSTLSGTDAGNYTLASGNTTASISPKAVTIAGITASNKTYDGTTDVTFSTSMEYPDGHVDGDDLSYSVEGAFADANAGADKTVNITAYPLSGADADNYYVNMDGSQTTTTATIAKATYDMSGVSFADVTVTYDGAQHTLKITGTLPEGVSVGYTNNKLTNVGTTTATAVFDYNKVNYVEIPNMTAGLTILPKELTVQWTVGTYVYTGRELTLPTATADTGIQAEGTLTLTVTSGDTFRDVGTHQLTASTDNDNYVLRMDSITCNVLILKATAVVSDIQAAQDLTFNKGAQDLLANPGTVNFGEILYKLGDGEYSNVPPQATDAGSYVVYYKVNGSANWEGVAETSLTVSIDRDTDSVKDLPEMVQGLTYSHSLLGLVAQAGASTKRGAEGLEYTLDDPTSGAAVWYAPDALDGDDFARIDAGTYTLSWRVAEDSNYYGAAWQAGQSAQVTIAPCVIGISWTNLSFDYDGQPHLPTATPIVLPGDSTVITLTVEGEKTAVGEGYLAQATALSASDGKQNYALPTSGLQEVTFEITAREIVVSGVSAEDKVYDGTTDVTFDYSSVDLIGVVDGDALSVVAEGAFTDKNAGAYKTVNITKLTLTGSASSNYVLAANGQQEEAMATITERPVRFAIADATSVYGADVAALSAAWMVANDKMSIVEGETVSYTLTAYEEVGVKELSTTSHVGNYPIVGEDTDANYAVSFVQGTYRVTKATLTVSADDAQVTYGLAAPEFGVYYEGFVGLDDASDLGGTLAFDCGYQVGNSAGSEFAITPMGYASNDYNFIYESGTLTVNKRTIKVVYKEALRDAEYDYTGEAFDLYAFVELDVSGEALGLYGDDVLQDVVALTIKESSIIIVPEAVDVGIYHFSNAEPKEAYAGNYLVDNGFDYPDCFIINAVAVTLTAPTAKLGLVYSGNPQDLLNAGSVVGGELQYSADNSNWSTDIPQGTDALDYVVYYRVFPDNNHNWVDSTPIEVSIAKATLEGVTFAGAEFTYDGTTHTLAIGGTALPDGVTVSYENNGLKDAGSREVRATFAVTSNWNELAAMTATLTVNPKTVTISIDDKESVYGEPLANLSATAYGIVEGDDPTQVYALVKEDGLNAGTYAINAVSAGDANYTLDAQPGTYTITKATFGEIVFEDGEFTYDGQPKSLAIGTALNDEIQVSYLGNGQVGAGTYQVTAQFQVSANYEAIADMTATLKINKAVYDMSGVSFPNVTVTYDGKEHVALIAGNLPNGVTVSYADNKLTQAGTIVATASFTGDAVNYEPIPSKSAVITINKATYDMSGVTFESVTAVYDGEEHVALITGDLPSGVSVSYTDNSLTNAGQVTAVASFTGDPNYEDIEDMTATICVNAKSIVVRVQAAESVYGEPLATLSATVQGLVEGDEESDIFTLVKAEGLNAGTYD
ncbi:MAG: hypothetical protein J5755_02060, partial [Clostridia bacterium]|nr:hypothetical protein [Clostridia bacterium]